MKSLSFQQKLWLPLAASLLCLCTVSLFQVQQAHELQVSERKADLANLDKAALTIVQGYAAGAAAGKFSEAEARQRAMAALKTMRYGEDGLAGTRFFDFELGKGASKLRIYSLLDYSRFTLFLFGEAGRVENLPSFVKVIRIGSIPGEGLWAKDVVYAGRAVLVRPDAYIAGESSLGDVSERIGDWLAEFVGG